MRVARALQTSGLQGPSRCGGELREPALSQIAVGLVAVGWTYPAAETVYPRQAFASRWCLDGFPRKNVAFPAALQDSPPMRRFRRLKRPVPSESSRAAAFETVYAAEASHSQRVVMGRRQYGDFAAECGACTANHNDPQRMGRFRRSRRFVRLYDAYSLWKIGFILSNVQNSVKPSERRRLRTSLIWAPRCSGLCESLPMVRMRPPSSRYSSRICVEG